jgi:hypothetical protein
MLKRLFLSLFTLIVVLALAIIPFLIGIVVLDDNLKNIDVSNYVFIWTMGLLSLCASVSVIWGIKIYIVWLFTGKWKL